MSLTEPGRINDRWDLNMTPDRVAFHADRPSWEAAHLDSMHAELAPGMVVYEIGAECGDFAALFGTWGCEVVAVEPQPLYWPAVKAHWEANVERPVLFAFDGFCAETGVGYAGYRECWPPSAKGRVVPDVGFKHLAVTDGSIQTATVDQIAALTRPPDALTIDVEGSEYRVLLGARHVLAEHHPLLWVSVHKDEAWMADHYPGEGLDAITEYLSGFGYTGVLLADEHEAHWLFRA